MMMMIASFHKESDFDDVDYALVFDADVVVVAVAVAVAADFDDVDYYVGGGVVGWSGSCCLYW